jgi:hypothetical protein
MGDSFSGLGFLSNFTLDANAQVGDMNCDPTNFNNLSNIWKHFHGEFEEGLMSGKG